MGDMLSQAEIDALLSASNVPVGENTNILTPAESDALGEIGNISMGASATTLYNLVGQKVTITTPKVNTDGWDLLNKHSNAQAVAVKIEYTRGLEGSNLLILKVDDVKIITDLMMGGDGSNIEGELNDFHLSAIGEAMNQMIGSSSTSLSQMFGKQINISPPNAFNITVDDLKNMNELEEYNSTDVIIISFKMEIGEVINSEIMQLMPFSFAKELVGNLLSLMDNEEHQYPQDEVVMSNNSPDDIKTSYKDTSNSTNRNNRDQVKIQPIDFENFDSNDKVTVEKKNISILMDVPLEVTVELGRTHKLIRDILEMSPGAIIELDKLAEEPVDILINGKKAASGEVVVIDESFGVRITDIIHPSKRL